MDIHAQDLYAVLGISPDLPADQLKRVYRAAARRFHPDVNANPGAALQFQEIARALEVLADAGTRQRYDQIYRRLVREQYFDVQLALSRRLLPIMNEPQMVYALAEIRACQPSTTTRQQSPLNLALVLDCSKSMQGARLENVKYAAHQIIDQLSERDYLSLIIFSDRAQVLITPEPVQDKPYMKELINGITPVGGTEIFQGLAAGISAVKQHYDPALVNHVLLLTDGKTYDNIGDSLALAEQAARCGIGISTMGIGSEWDDNFLDEVASKTGGTCAYISAPDQVAEFMNDCVRSLGSAFAERMTMTIAPDPDVELISAFRLAPNAQPIDDLTQPLRLGSLNQKQPIKILLQFKIQGGLNAGQRSFVRLKVSGDVLAKQHYEYSIYSELPIKAAYNPPAANPSKAILDAIGKVTYYRMQENAQQCIENGDFREGSDRLEFLASRLMENGHRELAQTVLMEAQRVRHTRHLSEEGRKTVKFQTRALLMMENFIEVGA